MRVLYLLFGLVHATLAVDLTHMPWPPCNIRKEIYYEQDTMEASRECWDSAHIPCATHCNHLKELLENYWNKDSKCDPIRKLGQSIKVTNTEPIDPKHPTFPNRKDCGRNNGRWKTTDGNFIGRISSATILMHKHGK